MCDTREGHPSTRWLLDLADGVGSGPRLRAARDHVDAGCPRCESTLAEFGALTAVIAAEPPAPPPRAVMRRAERLFTARKILAVVEGARAILASLVFDQRTEMVPAIRSAVGTTRRMLWLAGDYELFLQLELGATGWNLQGQALGSDDSEGISGDVRLLRAGRVVAQAHLDDTGSFTCDDLAEGRYSIDGDVDGQSFSVPLFRVD